MIRVGVLGATGYTGIELVTLLRAHPDVTIQSLLSTSAVGQDLSDVYPGFVDTNELPLVSFDVETVGESLDLLFLAVPHGLSHTMVPEILKKWPQLKIVDLSADYRLKTLSHYKTYYGFDHPSPQLVDEAVYGVPELFRESIKTARLVANPGCYAISSILGLLPLSETLSGSVIIDAKSGVTGAGKSLKESSLFCEANEAISAYSTGVHRHTAEILEITGFTPVFSPHLVPMMRGILTAIYLPNPTGLTKESLVNFYESYYQGEPFVSVQADLKTPSTKYTRYANTCMLTPMLSPDGSTIIVFSSIDNLQKGAAGQAIQNMNLMCGIDDTVGLTTQSRAI